MWIWVHFTQSLTNRNSCYWSRNYIMIIMYGIHGSCIWNCVHIGLPFSLRPKFMQPADTVACSTIEMDDNEKRRGRRRASRYLIEIILNTVAGAVATWTSAATATASLNNYGVGNIGKTKGAKTISRYSSRWSDLYLSSQPTYPSSLCRKLFRVPRTLFLKHKYYLVTHDPSFWSTCADGIGWTEIKSEVKILACLRLLGSGSSLDYMDYCQHMGKETLRMHFKRFWVYMKKIYDDLYLNRRQTQE